MQSPRIAPAEGSDPEALNIFRTLQRTPELYKGFLALGTHLLRGDVLTAREREIVILRVGYRCASEYEFAQHTRLGGAAGLTDGEIAALASEEGLDSPLVALADELCAADVVSDATWERLAETYDETQLLELLVLAGYYRLVSGLLNSAGVALESEAAGWPDGVHLRRAPRA